MRGQILLRVVCVALAIAAVWLVEPTMAQRGGGHGGGGGGFHGGGGGFHGGGGGLHGGGMNSFSGGHYAYGGARYGGYHGTGYHGWRGGSGWHGGHAGWGRAGWSWGRPFGWRFGFRFGWPYWWWGYPYAYAYNPWWYAPYSYDYPYSCVPGYPCPYDDNGDDPPPADRQTSPNPNGLSNPGRPSAPPGPGNANYMSGDVAWHDPRPILSVDRITATPADYRAVQRAVVQQSPKRNARVSPQVQNALDHLQDMPPFAREREIKTGRYSHFSPKERAYLLNAKY